MIDEIERCIQRGEVQLALKLIREAVYSGLDMRGRHVNFAHYLITNFDWKTINALLPPGTNTLSTSGFLNSLQGPRPVGFNGAPIPWLTYPAIDFLDGIVKPDWQVFEFGAGNSTLWWADRVNRVNSVESDSAWFEVINELIPKNVSLSLKQTDDEYVHGVNAFPTAHFDAIIVDGGPRSRCIEVAVAHLKENGVLVVDNSDISELNNQISKLDMQGFLRIDFWGLVPCYLYKNCTSIFFKNPDFLRCVKPPSLHKSSVGMSCMQVGESVT